MIGTDVFKEIKPWKKPVHIAKTNLAKSYLKILSNLDVIGITGSVGKTITQNAIASVLSQKFNVVVGNENLDPTFRIPRTILSAKPWHQKLVLEYGIEHPGDMDHYLSIVTPKIAVVTTISPTHIKYFKDTQGVFEEKSKLLKSLPKSAFALLNADDPKVVEMAKLTQAQIKWFGQRAKDGIKISHFAQSLNGAKFRLHLNGQKASVNWKVIGKHHLLSAYAAATVGIISGLTVKQIAKGLSMTKPPLHRLNTIVTKKVNIIDDTYNSSPKAALEAIETLIDLAKHKKKIVVLGEMKDLGALSEEAHELLGEKIAKSSINFLFTIGSIASSIAKTARKAHFKGKIYTLSNTKEAIIELRKLSSKNSVILIKGSRHAHLERIVQGLLGKSTKIHCYHCGDLA